MAITSWTWGRRGDAAAPVSGPKMGSGELDANEDPARPGARSAGGRRRSWCPSARCRRRRARLTLVVPTWRITSPTSRPASAALPLPSSEVMTTPLTLSSSWSWLAGGRGDRREGGAELGRGGAVLLLLAGLGRGDLLVLELAEGEVDGLVSAPLRRTSTLTVASGAAAATSFGSSRLDSTGLPSKETITSPVSSLPTDGPSATTSETRAPWVLVHPEGRGDLGAHVLDRDAEPAARRPRPRTGAGRRRS